MLETISGQFGYENIKNFTKILLQNNQLDKDSISKKYDVIDFKSFKLNPMNYLFSLFLPQVPPNYTNLYLFLFYTYQNNTLRIYFVYSKTDILDENTIYSSIYFVEYNTSEIKEILNKNPSFELIL